jgi:hypothetical protein
MFVYGDRTKPGGDGNTARPLAPPGRTDGSPIRDKPFTGTSASQGTRASATHVPCLQFNAGRDAVAHLSNSPEIRPAHRGFVPLAGLVPHRIMSAIATRFRQPDIERHPSHRPLPPMCPSLLPAICVPLRGSNRLPENITVEIGAVLAIL